MKENAFPWVVVSPQNMKLIPCRLMVLLPVLGPTACSTSNRERAGRDDSAHAGHAALELNNGKKWVMAKPMMVHIQTLEKRVQDFERTPGGDDAVLAQEVQEDLGRLVTSCTMEGKAHDELHKWLMPLLGVSAEYAKATDPTVQKEKRQEIRDSLQVFHSYFE